MKKLLILLFTLASLAGAFAQDPAQDINNALMRLHSNLRLYSKRDSARLDSLYKGLLGGGYVTYAGADARYRRTLAKIDYNLDVVNQPVPFSKSYNDLTDRPTIPVLPGWVTPTFPGYALSSNLGTLSTQNANSVSITGGTAILSSLNMLGYNSTAPQLRVGSLELQGAGSNQSFIGHNVHYEDGDFRRRTSDPAGYFGIQGNEAQVRLDNGGLANSYSTPLATRALMKIAYNGNWGIGASLPIEQGVFDGAAMMLNGASGNLLMGTTVDVPSSKLTISSTTQGFLPSRMSTAQIGAITLPAEGLLVYDLTLHVLKVYNGTTWKTLTTN